MAEKTNANIPDVAGTETPGKPTAIAYQVRTGSDKRSYWDRQGVEFPHKDGKGSTLLLEVVPFEGRIVVRDRADPEAEGATPGPEEAAPEKTGGTGRRAPDLIAYSVRSVEGGSSFWTEIGYAYKHSKGNGKTVQLHSFPRDYRVVLRDRAERVRKEPASLESAA